MRHDLIVGIDVGHDGAIAFMDVDTHFVMHVESMLTRKHPNAKKKSKRRIIDEVAINDLLHEYCDDASPIVFIEKQSYFAKQGASSAEKMFSYGVLVGLICGQSIPYEHVISNRWQKACNFVRGNDPKAQSVDRVRRLFAYVDLIDLENHPTARVPKDGRADAVNIADYGWLALEGNV